ncbi:hypothetical protein N7455_008891 [Penicillium solitum]|uniref:uncharacterized protein n=1 Tax=Penicillium solitum TaxID=60172 RepID=UPI0032C42597|nr:hypothetical protein N7455_008891 [Penicillium solitum]
MVPAPPQFGQSPERIDKAFSTLVASRAQSPATINPSLVLPSTRARHGHPNSQTSIISVSSARSSDIDELPASQSAAGEISWVGRSQDVLDIDLLTCLKTGFPNAFVNPALRSTTFGNEGIYLHCILCVAFDEKRASQLLKSHIFKPHMLNSQLSTLNSQLSTLNSHLHAFSNSLPVSCTCITNPHTRTQS